MTSTTTITMVDGVHVVVPNSIDLTTSYVLFEQHDWFEDEIRFLRRLIQPGQKIIDIGANCGVYTLALARRVGSAGRVWAFEPASATADLLVAGIAANRFSNIILERSALSSAAGSAQLALHGNSEENALVRNVSPETSYETVALVTLDERLQHYDWHDIDFMKIDAEGEEVNILRGGQKFFSTLSPLVQFEIKEGVNVHLELVQEFAAIGYDSYRLVPGLDVLVPFEIGEAPDEFLLNLFCCKPDRRNRLVADGWLVDGAFSSPAAADDSSRGGKFSGDPSNGPGWRESLAVMPYGRQLADYWEQTVGVGNSVDVERAIRLYQISQEASRAKAERIVALECSFRLFAEICERAPSFLRLSSLARVAQEFGARSIAVQALRQLGNDIVQRQQVDPTEPFLAPGKRFDTVVPGGDICNWVLAAVLEELERLSAFSSYFSGAAALQRLEVIAGLGFGSAEMVRRLQMVRQRVGAQ